MGRKNIEKTLGILLAALLMVNTACGVQGNESQTGNMSSGQEAVQAEPSSAGGTISSEAPAEPASEFYDKMVTIPKEYNIEDYSNGYFIVSKSDGRLFGLLDSDGKTGIVDLTGKVLINPEYEMLEVYSDNMFIAKKSYSDSKPYFLSRKGELINTINPLEILSGYKDTYISSYENNAFCCVALDSTDQVYIVLLDLQGKEIVKVKVPDNIKADIEHHLLSATTLELEQGNFIEVSSQSSSIGNAANSKETIVLDYSGNIHPELSVSMYNSPQVLAGLDHIIYTAVADNGVLVPKFVNTKTRSILPETSNCEYTSFGTFKDGQAFAVLRNRDDGLFYLTVINEKIETIKEISSFDLKWMSASELPILMEDKAIYFSNDTWKMISLDELETNQERYYGIQKLKDGKHWWILENADGENALLSPKGEFSVDFGNISSDSFLGEPVLQHVVSDEACCFVIEGETENKIYIVNS